MIVAVGAFAPIPETLMLCGSSAPVPARSSSAHPIPSPTAATIIDAIRHGEVR
jgi:hypothetical protein